MLLLVQFPWPLPIVTKCSIAPGIIADFKMGEREGSRASNNWTFYSDNFRFPRNLPAELHTNPINQCRVIWWPLGAKEIRKHLAFLSSTLDVGLGDRWTHLQYLEQSPPNLLHLLYSIFPLMVPWSASLSKQETWESSLPLSPSIPHLHSILIFYQSLNSFQISASFLYPLPLSWFRFSFLPKLLELVSRLNFEPLETPAWPF